MATQDFLFELGTEELPPKALLSLSNALEAEVLSGLKAALGKGNEGLVSECKVTSYAAPRRLALLIEGLATELPASTMLVTGPPSRIAYDNEGQPSKALAGFAKKCGTDVSSLEEVDGKMCFRQETPAKPIAAVLPGIFSSALNKLPIPKRMRWGSSRVEFVRPVKWLVMLFGDQVIDCEILGVTAGRTTRGHRFHYNQSIELGAPASYASVLEETGYVVADFAKRREMIRSQVTEAGQAAGGVAQISDDLLDEVTALNEWPVALTGRFEERFLDVPAQALISSMKEHQKYFHVNDAAGNLMPLFITVSNIESKDPAQVIAGNEKVIRPRLADAAFFFESDKKKTLDSRVESLKTVLFQKELGSIYDKAARIGAIASAVAAEQNYDIANVQRAARLSKTDLMTEMVYEFTDLQGLMGYHYALHDGEHEDVAKSLDEQYMPRFAGDELPQTEPGIAIAIADRLDTLVGLFGINQPPTGSKDPFALRRAALGVLRIIIERKLSIDLKALIEVAAAAHLDLPAKDTVVDKVFDFMLDRLRAFYEEQGIKAEAYLAVLAVKPTSPLDFDARVRAVSHFQTLAESEALAAANKRVSNILSKQEGELSSEINPALFAEEAETALANALVDIEPQLAVLSGKHDYQGALELLAGLRDVVDTFFDSVMVMADDPDVQRNRLALLKQLRTLFLGVADISVL